MITLPPGFDVSALLTSFVDLLTPFVTVAILFVAYRLIMRSIGSVH